MFLLCDRLAQVVDGSARVDSTDYQIARTLLGSLGEVGTSSIGEVAELCGVSKSTLSRFVRGLGFDDYADFRAAAAQYWNVERYYEDGLNITDYLCSYGAASYVRLLEGDIEELFDHLDKPALVRAARLLHDRPRVVALGELYSGTAALNLQMKMAYFRKFVLTARDEEKQEQLVDSADEDTVIFVFSNSGRYISCYTRREGLPQKHCFDHTKATVVLVTSNPDMRRDSRVDLCILIPYNGAVHDHPLLFQLVIEQIAAVYQRMYGAPDEQIHDAAGR